MSVFCFLYLFYFFEAEKNLAAPSLQCGTSRMQDLDATAAPLRSVTSHMAYKFSSLVVGPVFL